jgi:hypothetical protein
MAIGVNIMPTPLIPIVAKISSSFQIFVRLQHHPGVDVRLNCLSLEQKICYTFRYFSYLIIAAVNNLVSIRSLGAHGGRNRGKIVKGTAAGIVIPG